jgi:dihydrofolate reductase
MAHVIHSINVTVSGRCHHADAIADEEHHRYALELLSASRAVLLGRQTFELFESFWPQAEQRADLPRYMTEFAAALNATPKYVVSSRTVATEWRSTRSVRGPDLDEVRRLISGETGTIAVLGSPGLGTSLLAAGLVDEIHVLAQPFIGVEGTRAFDGLTARHNLALVEGRPFRSGVVLLRYAVK